LSRKGHGWFLRRYDYRKALSFLNFVEELSIRVDGFDGLELVKAKTFVKKFADQELTLADAHGLAVMKSRRIASCCSTDRHLGLTGATLVY
jgi:hypothetical protein